MIHRFWSDTRLRLGAAAALALGFGLATPAAADDRLAALSARTPRLAPAPPRALAPSPGPVSGAPLFGFVEFDWPDDEGVPGFAGWRPRPAPTREAGR